MDNQYHVVFTHHSHQVCVERQFVLQSRGIDSQLVEAESAYALIVDSRFAQQAQIEMASYVDENIINAPQPANVEPRSLNYLPALIGYALVLCIVSTAAGFSLFGMDWYQQGRVNSEQIHQGEIWRLVTALTLHANAQHLVSNLAFGSLFLFYFSRYVGYGLAGLSVLATGAFGNAINVYMQGTTHLSIGASTAVFGALGLLSAYVWKMKYFSQATWSKRLGPILAVSPYWLLQGRAVKTRILVHIYGGLPAA